MWQNVPRKVARSYRLVVLRLYHPFRIVLGQKSGRCRLGGLTRQLGSLPSGRRPSDNGMLSPQHSLPARSTQSRVPPPPTPPTPVPAPRTTVSLPARRSEGYRPRRAGLSVFSGNAFDTINYQEIDRRLAGFQP